MKSLAKRLFHLHIVRYGLVGGIGIPVNDLALLVFKFLFSHILPPNLWLYAVASACAFEVSNIVNFVLNQVFTYHEQLKDIHGREWIRRAARGQLTSLSAMLLSYGAGLLLVGVFHVNDFIANPAGIIVAFIYNFFISKKLVFRPAKPATTTKIGESENSGQPMKQIEATPKA